MGLLSDLREIAQELLDDAGIDDKVGRAAHLIADAFDDLLDRLADVVHDDDVPTFDPTAERPEVDDNEGQGDEPEPTFDPVPPVELNEPADPDHDHTNPEVLP